MPDAPVQDGSETPRRTWADEPPVANPLPQHPRYAELTAAGLGLDEDRGVRVQEPGALPTFADVGGMEDLKQELRDTVGLVLEHGDEADRYGITWNGILLHGPPGVGKSFFAQAVAGEFGLRLLHVSTGDLVSSYASGSAQNVARVFQLAARTRPCLLFFDEFDSVAQRREQTPNHEDRRTVNQLLTSLEANRAHRDLVVMAATNNVSSLDAAVIRPGRFDRQVRIDRPDLAARRAVLAVQLASRPTDPDVDLDDLARRTDGATPADLTRVVSRAALDAFREAAATGQVVHISMAHLRAALDDQGGQDRPTVEDWSWDHLVLPRAILAELQQVEAMLTDPDLADRFGVERPTGLLLAGPPGTGKTTIARVLAAQSRCSFYPVSAAEVTSKWAGESEQRIAELFERARANRPSIVFLDEVDAIGSRRAEQWSDRQLNQLLHEMDGLGSTAGVLVIGATNRPEVLDPALTRGGRLSRTIVLELPDLEARLQLLEHLMVRMPTVAVDRLDVALRTEGMSGADLEAVCQQAAVRALVRARGEAASEGDVAAAVLHEDVLGAVADRRASEATAAAN